MSMINRIFPTLAQDLNRAFALFEEPFANSARRFPAAFPSLSRQEYFRPAVDVAETEKSYIVEAEVPGMRKEDLSVEFVDDNTLVVKGKTERTIEQSDRPLRLVDSNAATEAGEQSSNVVESTKEQDKNAVENANERVPTFWNVERTVGSFQRSFQFPGRVSPDNVKAAYKDGILSITVPKLQKQGTKINIE
jgi:HSP20 family protein